MMQEDLGHALAAFQDGPLRERTAAVLNCLGYESNRTRELGTVADFLKRYDTKKLTERQRALFDDWQDVALVFQVTDTEIQRSGNAPAPQSGRQTFDGERTTSFLFLGVELTAGHYSRTTLGEMARAVNKLFLMPVVLIFRCEGGGSAWRWCIAAHTGETTPATCLNESPW